MQTVNLVYSWEKCIEFSVLNLKFILQLEGELDVV